MALAVQPVILGLSVANMVVLALTLLEGGVHLTLFALFLVLVFSP